MAVNLSDFVKVNITRDTLTTSSSIKKVAYIYFSDNSGIKEGTYSSLEEIIINNEGNVSNQEAVYKACEKFFNMGGKNIYLKVASSSSSTPVQSAIATLPLEVIAFSTNYSNPASLVTYLDNLAQTGTAYRKMVMLDINNTSSEVASLTSNNCAVKIVGSTEGEYACMGMLAYLSRISLDYPDTIADYCFTKEPGITPVENTFNWTDIKDKFNVNLGIFGGVSTNFGGNTLAGTDLVEEYMVIAIAQDILISEYNLLQTKLTEGNAVSLVNATLRGCLDKYYDAGFLTKAVYSGNDVFATKLGKEYSILRNGQLMDRGYIINILPLNARSDEEIKNKSLPDIYIVLNTYKGIRHIDNIGKVI